MSVKWTEAQLDAINSQNGTVLVSAAAGSGKTAVLVQRAINRLTDPQNPTPADKLLIVTFTRAAAAEMRARLEKKLYEMLREDPGNEILRRQCILLSQANIGTVHGFCSNLIKEFFYLLDMPHDFVILTDKQKDQMRQEALEEVVADSYKDEGFIRLADTFSTERDDRRLMEVVLETDKYMQSHPYPEKWMDSKIDMYFKGDNVGDSIWGKSLLGHISESAQHVVRILNEAIRLSMEDGALYEKFLPVLTEDIRTAELIEATADLGDWDRLYSIAGTLKFSILSAPKGYKDDSLKLKIAAIRDEAKRILKGIKPIMITDEQGCLKDFPEVGEILKELKKVTFEFSRVYQEKKLEKNFLDYSDLEHLVIKLLRNDDGTITKTAMEISERYEEIMVDEYQDTNEVQDTIFRAISKNEENLFMVGDVKQSIYSFRCAMPEIFISNRTQYKKYDRELDKYPAYVVLDSNFRSRKGVTESVNFVFSQIMSKSTGDIDYNEEEELVYGADYEDTQEGETEFYLLDCEKESDSKELESAFIAERIKDLMAGGMRITENGEERPLRFKDFCILIRSANSRAPIYAAALDNYGIPAKATGASGFFATKEMGFMLSLLRVIDNPNQDIPLLSVMLSPVYGFSPDDVAHIRSRAEEKKKSMYLSVAGAADGNPLCKTLIEDIAMFRSAAAAMPADVFLDFLYEHTGYTDIVMAMENGEMRLANLHFLQKYAGDYESSSSSGVSGFVRFIDKLAENRVDLEISAPPSDDDDMVRIMSIHSSKGLEFPVCILADCNGRTPPVKGEVLLHPELGLGINLKSGKLGARYSTVAREAIKLDTKRRNAAEEMRILYVAMTRAKHKLIMLGTVKKADEYLSKCAAEITEKGISEYSIKSDKKFLRWLTLCALRHPDGATLRSTAGSGGANEISVYRKNYVPWHVEIVRSYNAPCAKETEKSDEAQPDETVYRQIREAIDYEYPFKIFADIPSKVTASALSAAEYEKESGITLRRPAWLSAKGMTPAERGTALHNYMQYTDFKQASKNPELEMERLVKKEFLSPEEAGAVELKHVKAFFSSEIGRMVLSSDNIQKERRFTVEIPAREVNKDLPEEFADAKVILQGAVDCTFVLDGKIHIIDFKTDRVKNARELAGPYSEQIRLYGKAMEHISPYEVGKLYLYSMFSDSYVEVEKKSN